MSNKTFKTILCLLCMMALIIVTGCQSTSNGNTASPSGTSNTPEPAAQTDVITPSDGQESSILPISKEKITLKAFAAQTNYVTTTDWNELLVWKEFENRTNIHFDWTIVGSSALAERRNLSLASGDLPDVYFNSEFSATDIVNYGSEGVFVPLNNYIAKNAPNITKMFEDYPSMKSGLTLPDGNIYTLPKASINLNQCYNAKMWINNVWLKKAGLNLPTTTDEFYNMLVTFSTGDFNGNGKADEIPLTSDNLDRIFWFVGGSYGLWNRGTQNLYFDYDEQADAVRFIPTSDRYKELLQFFNKLYSEKLFDQEYMNSKTAVVTANLEKEIVGAFVFNHPNNAGAHASDFVGLTNALKGPYGDQLIPNVSGIVQTSSSFIMTKNNKYPDETIKWMDYFLGEEGSELFFMGIKDQSYYVNSDGEFHFTDEILKNPDGLDQNGALSKYTNWSGSNLPCLRQLMYVLDLGDGLPVAVDVTNALKDYFPKDIWNTFWFTADESAELTAISTDIKTYISQMQNEFIIGRTSFDKWGDYLDTLKRLGADRFTEIYQASYDRIYGK